jgi:hypothetical protein
MFLHTIIGNRKGMVIDMKRKLIIDGNAVYEIDEDCMLKKRLNENKDTKEQKAKNSQNHENQARP